MKRSERYERALFVISRFLTVFGVVGFFISCCIMLFVNLLADNLGITLTNDTVELAAKLTLLNVIALSLIFTAVDLVRVHFTVERRTRRIIEAAEKMATGDFSVRIPTQHSIGKKDSFSKIAECFNKMAEELSSTEALRSDFVANVSHELKTPLAVIQNYASILRSQELSHDKRQEYLGAITATTGKLAALVSNILKLNKLENHKLAPKSELFDLGEQVAECLLGYEDLLDKKSLAVECDVEDGIKVATDKEMLSLVWNNLISNAIKFTENGGKISLGVHTEGELAAVTVADTGYGISGDVGKHIFEKFYQGDTSHSSEGNGLGLALVKRVADITSSDIFVESTPSVGTVFTVKMKRATDEQI